MSNHIKSILDKLHLDNRIQAAVKAGRAGISWSPSRQGILGCRQ